MIWLSLIATLFLLWAICSLSSRHTQAVTSAADRARHASDDDGHIYYVKNDQMIHECDAAQTVWLSAPLSLRARALLANHSNGQDEDHGIFPASFVLKKEGNTDSFDPVTLAANAEEQRRAKGTSEGTEKVAMIGGTLESSVACR